MKKYIKPTINICFIGGIQMIAASGDILGGTTGSGFTPLAKEVEVKNPDLWDNSNEMWALEDEEE